LKANQELDKKLIGGKLDTWTEAFDSTLVEFELHVQQSTQNGATGC
jgi:hypothetical protein